ncbi:MAG: AAA family ATPase, partial [Bacteroidia bacterium]
FTSRIDLNVLTEKVSSVKAELGKYLVGQNDMVEFLIIALLSDGHVLVEGVPGVAKTLTSKLLARTINASFKRIQFTPDLMPSDITGSSVYNAKTTEFEFKRGPLFANIVLTDEINRAPAKTQAALFEAMEEKQITVDGISHVLEKPFMVIATQNPVEHEGTYRLPEAQLDRFIFKLVVGYPSLEEETSILVNMHNNISHADLSAIKLVLDKNDILTLRKTVSKVLIEENLVKYIAQIVGSTRQNPSIYLGASPRASLAIMQAAKASACIRGRDFVSPDDIKHVARPVMRHRIILTPEKEMEGITADTVIQQLIDKIEIPR